MLSKETLAIRVYDDLDAKQPGANFSGKTVADFQKACGVEFKDIDDLNIHLIMNGLIPIPKININGHDLRPAQAVAVMDLIGSTPFGCADMTAEDNRDLLEEVMHDTSKIKVTED